MNSADQTASWAPQDIEAALQQVLSRARADAAFRELCLKDSDAAVKEAIHQDLPAGFTVRFVDNARADLTVVLPDLIQPEKELSDEDLEVVAGGTSKPTYGPRKITPV